MSSRRFSLLFGVGNTGIHRSVPQVPSYLRGCQPAYVCRLARARKLLWSGDSLRKMHHVRVHHVRVVDSIIFAPLSLSLFQAYRMIPCLPGGVLSCCFSPVPSGPHPGMGSADAEVNGSSARSASPPPRGPPTAAQSRQAGPPPKRSFVPEMFFLCLFLLVVLVAIRGKKENVRVADAW